MADCPTGSTRLLFTLLAGVAVTLAAPSPGAAQAGARELTMRLYDGIGLPERMTSDLRAVTESVLAPTGITVRWRLRTPVPARPGPPGAG